MESLAKSLSYIFVEETCCLCTPSLAHKWHTGEREEVLFDIDTRFSYMPRFRYYDMKNPEPIDNEFRLLVIDPPFFAIPIELVREAVDKITNKQYNTGIVIAFLKRDEKRLRMAFADYNLVPTKICIH